MYRQSEPCAVQFVEAAATVTRAHWNRKHPPCWPKQILKEKIKRMFKISYKETVLFCFLNVFSYFGMDYYPAFTAAKWTGIISVWVRQKMKLVRQLNDFLYGQQMWAVGWGAEVVRIEGLLFTTKILWSTGEKGSWSLGSSIKAGIVWVARGAYD